MVTVHNSFCFIHGMGKLKLTLSSLRKFCVALSVWRKETSQTSTSIKKKHTTLALLLPNVYEVHHTKRADVTLDKDRRVHKKWTCDVTHRFLKSPTQWLWLSPSWQCLPLPNAQVMQMWAKRWSVGVAQEGQIKPGYWNLAGSCLPEWPIVIHN